MSLRTSRTWCRIFLIRIVNVCPVKGRAFTHPSETYQIHYSRWHESFSQQARYHLHCVSNPAEMQIEFDASQKTSQVLSHQGSRFRVAQNVLIHAEAILPDHTRLRQDLSPNIEFVFAHSKANAKYRSEILTGFFWDTAWSKCPQSCFVFSFNMCSSACTLLWLKKGSRDSLRL